jgi:hypothetical protein
VEKRATTGTLRKTALTPCSAKAGVGVFSQFRAQTVELQIPRFCGKVVGLLRLPLPLLFLLRLRAFRLAARPRAVQFLAPPDAKKREPTRSRLTCNSLSVSHANWGFFLLFRRKN